MKVLRTKANVECDTFGCVNPAAFELIGSDDAPRARHMLCEECALAVRDGISKLCAPKPVPSKFGRQSGTVRRHKK